MSSTERKSSTKSYGSRMFKRFSVEEHVSTSSKVKSSQQRTIRGKILEQYPLIEPYLEELVPKKAPLVVAKWLVDWI